MAAGLIFMVSMSWYVTLPMCIGVARAINSTVTMAEGRLTINTVEYVCYIWGPLFIVFILFWAILNSQRRDVESEVYS